MLKNEIFILEAAYRENQFAFETQFRSVHELKNLAGPEMKTGSLIRYDVTTILFHLSHLTEICKKV